MDVREEVRTEIEKGSLFVINHSGGKDSQAMTILLSKIIPKQQILVIHAELPEVDWEGIPAHIEHNSFGLPVLYTRARKTFFEMVERRFERKPSVPSFPSPSTRQCTSDLKRGPIDKAVRSYLKDNPQHNGRVVHCIGIRAEESTGRAKAKDWTLYQRESIAGRTVFHWLPIHGLTESEVFSTIKVCGQTPHPAYSMGMTRLSCCFCIMSSHKDLKTASMLKPVLFSRYIELEKRTGYTMSMSRRSLETICA